MICFKNWQLTANGPVARQFDHLSRKLEVFGDFPEGWSWEMLVQVGSAKDTIPMDLEDGDLVHVLTRDELSIGNEYYRMQLRGTKGEVVKHTNIVQVFVPESLSGDGTWPSVPGCGISAKVEDEILIVGGE